MEIIRLYYSTYNYETIDNLQSNPNNWQIFANRNIFRTFLDRNSMPDIFIQNPKKKYIYIYITSVEIHRNLHTHNILHPSELTPLASPPSPSLPDNNRDNYTVRTIIGRRHGARGPGRANNERAPSYFHEMSHQIMAGCERAGKETSVPPPPAIKWNCEPIAIPRALSIARLL